MSYKYGFKTNVKNIIQFKKGLSKEIIKKISLLKNENKYFSSYRLKSFDKFKTISIPKWAKEILPKINFNEYIYYSSAIKDKNVPKEILDTYEKLGINEKEKKLLSGLNEQFDSETILHEQQNELNKSGVIFCSIDEAIKKYPNIVKKYFGKLVKNDDNMFSALNSCVFSGGSFLYVPEGVHINKPLTSYFRINTKSVGQFERTLIVMEKNSSAHYMEGCTAPIFSSQNLHAAVVEIFVKENASLRYTTIQNWSKNVINLVTKRAIVEENGVMEWIDGNIGSGVNMKYPCTILNGDNSKGVCVSAAISTNGMIQDTGAKMIHIGRKTRSKIISKSIASNNGIANYRGFVKICSNANDSFAEVICDSLILDKNGKSSTIPIESISNQNSFIKHEAKVTNLDKEMVFYLNSRNIDEKTAREIICLGFIEPFSQELPLEYIVELRRLMKDVM